MRAACAFLQPVHEIRLAHVRYLSPARSRRRQPWRSSSNRARPIVDGGKLCSTCVLKHPKERDAELRQAMRRHLGLLAGDAN